MRFDEKTKKLKFNIDEVLFCDTENKSLPFRTAADCKVKTVKNWNDFIRVLNDACGNNDLSSFPKRKEFYAPIKVVAIDSFTRLTYLLAQHLKALGSKGYSYWGDYAEAIESLLMNWSSNGRFIIYTGIDEVVRDADSVDRKVVKVDGKKLEGLIESYFSITLFTHFNSMKKPEEAYQFCTNTDGRNSAKSPIDMFSDRYIPNDMSLVLGSIYDYYQMSSHPEFMPSPILVVGKSGTGKSTSMKYLFDIVEEVKK